ncbi:MAG: Ricin-type beta-trefoil lectin domain [Solirubrobacteraceae bacterium]|nr:Ricin-type beta-trefoil lectin domain [Solirubrobacteraceae bacterium]
MVSIESDPRSPNPNPACVDAHDRVVGTQVWLWQCFGPDHANQRWIRTAEMQFILADTKGSSRELCMDGGSGTERSLVTIQVCRSGAANQKWDMLGTGSGELQLQDSHKLCLTAPNESNANGNLLILDACHPTVLGGQRWSYRDPRGVATAG